MKVTVEIPDEQWARLEEQARDSGCEQPARLIGEAVEKFLARRVPADRATTRGEATHAPPFLDADETQAWPAMLFVVREMRKHPEAVEAAISELEAGKPGQVTRLSMAIAELLPRWRDAIRDFAAYTRNKPIHGDPDDEKEVERLAGILSLQGSISDEEAEAWKANIRELRSTWR
jgi:hypothetical protein